MLDSFFSSFWMELDLLLPENLLLIFTWVLLSGEIIFGSHGRVWVYVSGYVHFCVLRVDFMETAANFPKVRVNDAYLLYGSVRAP